MKTLKTCILSLVLMAVSFGQTALTSTTLSSRVSDTATTSVTLASLTGITAGQTLLFVDREQMYVNGLPGSGTTVSVTRGYGGTRASTHASGTTVYIGGNNIGPYAFTDFPKFGDCTAANEVVLPQIITAIGEQASPTSGFIEDCFGSLWQFNDNLPRYAMTLAPQAQRSGTSPVVGATTSITAQAGGANTTSAGTGAAGGPLALASGAGGLDSTGAATGGAGGLLSLTGGVGGGTITGGVGGAITETAGVGGAGSTANGAGGAASLIAGAAGAGSGTAATGGVASLAGGAGSSIATAGAGGAAAVTGGVGGTGATAAGTGGAASLTGGAATTTAGTAAVGGAATVVGGVGSPNTGSGATAGAGGATSVTGGAGGAASTGAATGGAGGSATLAGGAGGGTITGGAGGAAAVTAGNGANGSTAGGAGGAVTITAGNAGTGGTPAGGNITLVPGIPTSTGVTGKVLIAGAAAASHLASSQTTAPVPTGTCTTPAVAAGSTDMKGTGSAASCTSAQTVILTFNKPYASTPICVVSPSTVGAAVTASAQPVAWAVATTTALTITSPTVSTTNPGWNYICVE